MPAEAFSTNSIPKLNDNLLRLEQVMQITSLCRSHVYLLMEQDAFPTSITVGVRGARWSELEVREWIAKQIAQARKTIVDESLKVGSAA